MTLYTKTWGGTRRVWPSLYRCHERRRRARGFAKTLCVEKEKACRSQQRCNRQWRHFSGQCFSATIIWGARWREEWTWDEMVGGKKTEMGEVSDQPVDGVNRWGQETHQRTKPNREKNQRSQGTNLPSWYVNQSLRLAWPGKKYNFPANFETQLWASITITTDEDVWMLRLSRDPGFSYWVETEPADSRQTKGTRQERPMIMEIRGPRGYLQTLVISTKCTVHPVYHRKKYQSISILSIPTQLSFPLLSSFIHSSSSIPWMET